MHRLIALALALSLPTLGCTGIIEEPRGIDVFATGDGEVVELVLTEEYDLDLGHEVTRIAMVVETVDGLVEYEGPAMTTDAGGSFGGEHGAPEATLVVPEATPGAPVPSDVLDALGGLSDEVRASLGDSLADAYPAADPDLQRVVRALAAYAGLDVDYREHPVQPLPQLDIDAPGIPERCAGGTCNPTARFVDPCAVAGHAPSSAFCR